MISSRVSELSMSLFHEHIFVCRKHVEYMGGFHPSHQIVRWLWDVVGKDFDACEKGLFLKVCRSSQKQS